MNGGPTTVGPARVIVRCDAAPFYIPGQVSTLSGWLPLYPSAQASDIAYVLNVPASGVGCPEHVTKHCPPVDGDIVLLVCADNENTWYGVLVPRNVLHRPELVALYTNDGDYAAALIGQQNIKGWESRFSGLPACSTALHTQHLHRLHIGTALP